LFLGASYLLADKGRVISRLRELSHGSYGPALEPSDIRQAASFWKFLPKLGALVSSGDRGRVDDLRVRLMFAGYVHPQAPSYFVAFRLLTVALFGLAAGLGAWLGFNATLFRALYWVGVVGGVGYLVPSLLLSSLITRRQNQLQKGLPNALDVLVLCLEGGLTFHAAMQWVTDELDAAHPELGGELAIANHEMQMGIPAGEALKRLADRTGLESARDLAALLTQSDKLGVGLAKTLRSHAEAARREHRMKVEENAQKAAVKILFPTLLCIFPAIFIVLLGPAAFQLAKLFSR
jgi:tight adherence protein C